LTIRIPVNLEAREPLEHLTNEGHLDRAIMEAGRVATETLYQKVADRYNALNSYKTEDGYKLSRDHQNTEMFVCPYGDMSIFRSHFYNGHKKLSDTPFERETLMKEHRMTPMAQYILLRMLAEKGPLVSASKFAEERRATLSHHKVDTFLEDMGMKYQHLRSELMEEVIREDWRPRWCPSLAELREEGTDEVPTENVNRTGDSKPAPTLMAELASEHRRPVLAVVQIDAMKVAVREYEERTKNGKPNYQKYTVKWHELHNAVVGFHIPDGPREPNDRIELHERRYFSEYFVPDALPRATASYLKTCGLQPGDLVLLCGDGARAIWRRYREEFRDYQRVEILDVQHCKKNLRAFAEIRYPKRESKPPRWVEKRMSDLYEGRYDSFFCGLRYAIRSAESEDAKEKLSKKQEYFQRNRHRIRYKKFLELGYPISTCFVESAHNHVIADRVRKHGRSYRDDRLQMIADFRSEFKSNRLPYVFQRILEVEAPKHKIAVG